ncbi:MULTISPECIES: DUF1214 domain-containing protein [Gordonia]|uniref:DUF1214 domain-containing protein n=1 Tax=Gordonia TaxID=2053 RepID=UPI0033988305
MQAKDWGDVPAFDAGPSAGAETKWVDPQRFFDQLGEVLQSVPPQRGEEALYAQFAALLDSGERDPAIRRQIVDAFHEADDTFVANAMRWQYNGKAVGNGWNRSVNNSEWGLDYYNRAATSRSNMFENRANETQYYYLDVDSAGVQLTGEHQYEVTFAAGDLPPVDGFWSLTMYDPAHFFVPNELARYSLGTKNKSLVYGEDGSLTLQVGNSSPEKRRQANWLPSPAGEFSLYLRAYGGRSAIADGSWIPPVVTRR